MQPSETVYIDTMVAACNGGGGALGHPKVFLNLAADGKVECPYCSRLFIHESHRAAAQSHGVEPPGPGSSLKTRQEDHPPPAAPARP